MARPVDKMKTGRKPVCVMLNVENVNKINQRKSKGDMGLASLSDFINLAIERALEGSSWDGNEEEINPNHAFLEYFGKHCNLFNPEGRLHFMQPNGDLIRANAETNALFQTILEHIGSFIEQTKKR